MEQCKPAVGYFQPDAIPEPTLVALKLSWPSRSQMKPESAFDEMVKQLIDGLPEQAAIVDNQWNIIAVNEPWAAAVRQQGYVDLEPGGNYQAFYSAKAADGYKSAIVARDGIAELETGIKTSFRFVDEDKGILQEQVFEVWVNRVRLSDGMIGIVTRIDISELCDLRRMRDRFSDIILQGQVQERRRITREIHDSTMQLLACLSLALGRLKRPRRSKQTIEIIAEMENLLSEAQSELRTFSYLAHPPRLEELGLHDALAALVDGFGRRSGLKTVFHWEGDCTVGKHASEVALYRVVQEALSNVHRHACASNVTVILAERNDVIEAKVLDDGVGMPSRPVHGVGISGMRARLAELNGRLTVRSTSNGTELIAVVPKNWSDSELISD